MAYNIKTFLKAITLIVVAFFLVVAVLNDDATIKGNTATFMGIAVAVWLFRNPYKTYIDKHYEDEEV